MYEIETLPNGVRIIREKNESVRSAALGVWVGSGSRHEPAALGGVSHFIEHMLFKGTERRTAAELAADMDALGGEVNAFTTKECTCYYGRVLDEKLEVLINLLAEMLLESRYEEANVVLERGVILEEIGMYEDNPDDLAVENLLLQMYRGTPLGFPILGKPETLEGITGDTLRQYHAKHYTGDAIVIALAGQYTDTQVAHIRRKFAAVPSGARAQSEPGQCQTALHTVDKQTEQSHIAIGMPALSYLSPQRYALQMLNGILGGNMSSRLFQRIREQLGLCYSIHSFLSTHADSGVLGIYTGTGKKTEREALAEIGAELRRIVRDGVTDDEVERMRDQIKSGLLMGMESTSSRMNHMGKGLLLQGEVQTIEQVAEAYAAVRREEIIDLARDMLRPERLSVSAVAKKADSAAYGDWLREGMEG